LFWTGRTQKTTRAEGKERHQILKPKENLRRLKAKKKERSSGPVTTHEGQNK